MPNGRNISLVNLPLCLGTGKPDRCGSGDWELRSEHLQHALERFGCSVENAGSLPFEIPFSWGNPRAKYLREITAACNDVGAWVKERHEGGRFPLVMGGDHSIAAGTVAGSATFFRGQGKQIGMIWLDAHADMNTPETTPSGHVHGMALAALLGLGPAELSGVLGFSPKLSPEQIVLIGIREVDPEEYKQIAASGLRVITMREVDERGIRDVMLEALEIVNRGTAGYHLSFDIDALDPSIAPGVATPAPGGLTFREAHLAMEMIADDGRMVSMDMVEINPLLDHHGLTAKVSVGLISSALGKTILPPGVGKP